MKTSHFPIFTLKDIPSEAELISHKLMIKSGIVRQLSSGLYTWLPLGHRILEKIKKIIREEMNSIGSTEITMPLIQPAELWKESGRWDEYGPELLRINDRHEREYCFGPTFEEVITDLIRKEVSSYKQLPINLFQISTKFRDEIRPRFGVMRAREFVMKDSYSFHNNEECLNNTYKNYAAAYEKIFKRLMLDFTTVEADSGNIGGNESHEFHVIADTGEDDLLLDKSSQGMNFEIAKTKYGENDLQKIIKENDLKHVKGIEVGHIFKLGDKYSSKMKAEITTKESKKINLLMGCYGIGVSRIVAAAIEQNNDDKGIIWPSSISPFDIALIEIDGHKDKSIRDFTTTIYKKMKELNIDVIYDDRDSKLGSKLTDWELIGIPTLAIIGSKEVKNNVVTLKNRIKDTKIEITIENLLDKFL
ncbi:MAG: proline--tRNA ligase [Pseudomonadota bacterium]|nr:proline--tRNA ligase [Pseudomonadota bacterium]|tara:strand:- start:3176 stop:4429 length:1254 start_codon:yes stop_codon:yes gene_type:complete